MLETPSGRDLLTSSAPYTQYTRATTPMDMKRAHPLLSQVPLAINPAAKAPKAVTLPYNYNRLPETLPTSAADVELLERIIMDSSGFLDALDARHTDRVEAYESWAAKVKESQIKEQRRIAPGYLDVEQRILQPDRSTKASNDNSTQALQVNYSKAEAEQQEQNKQQPPNEIDKAFGQMSLR